MRHIEIPTEVKIKKGITYRVHIVNKIPYQVEGESLTGYCHQETRTIWVSKRQRRPGLEKAFLHELIHAIQFEYELKIDHDDVYDLEKALYEVFRINNIKVSNGP